MTTNPNPDFEKLWGAALPFVAVPDPVAVLAFVEELAVFEPAVLDGLPVAVAVKLPLQKMAAGLAPSLWKHDDKSPAVFPAAIQ